MSKSWDLLRKYLESLATTRGFKADLARKMGISRSQMQTYLDGERTPGLDMLDRFAEALGTQAWELIKPDAALPTPQPENPDTEALASVIAKQAARIKALEMRFEALSSVPADILAALPYFPAERWEIVRPQFLLYKEYAETGKLPELNRPEEKKKKKA
jgi:transcriptional regulator with XRE-family HTH domain